MQRSDFKPGQMVAVEKPSGGYRRMQVASISTIRDEVDLKTPTSPDTWTATYQMSSVVCPWPEITARKRELPAASQELQQMLSDAGLNSVSVQPWSSRASVWLKLTPAEAHQLSQLIGIALSKEQGEPALSKLLGN